MQRVRGPLHPARDDARRDRRRPTDPGAGRAGAHGVAGSGRVRRPRAREVGPPCARGVGAPGAREVGPPRARGIRPPRAGRLEPSRSGAVPAAAAKPAPAPADQPAPAAGQPAPAPADQPAAAAADLTGAAAFVRAFYADLTKGDFKAAWPRLAADRRAEHKTFDAWRRGFATTVRQSTSPIAAKASGPNAALVTLTLTAVDRNPCGKEVERHFAVTWRLKLADGKWHAAHAAARPLEQTAQVAACT